MHFFQQLFSADFMPHGHCYFWRPEIVWLHVISDGLITLAYCSIPLALTYFVRKRGDIAFEWIFAMFGVFIFACGTTHALEVLTIWNPIYRFAGVVKALTAIASVGCAVALWKLMPRMIALPSPAQLREINARLEKEVGERTRAQEEERRARDLVEERVRERTAELQAANATLQQEIASRTQAERALRANEQQFHAVLDHSPTIMQVVDRAGRYVFVNRRFETLLKVKAADVGGKMPWEIFPAPRAAALSADDAEVIRTGEAAESEVEMEHDGELHIYAMVKFPLLDAQGEVYAACGSFRDVTKRKQKDEELHRAREEAERANAAKSDFLSRVSHELRTPLNAVLGFAQVLEMDGPDAQQQASIEQILRGGRHLLELINELLDLSRLEAGSMTISPEPVEVNVLLRECVDLIIPLAKQRQITIERLFEKNPAVHALADAQRLKQVVINLLSNAVKYNHVGGSVALGTEEVPVDLIRITVQDDGAGIAEADLGRVFNPFERISADASLGIEGTGLGLALSRRLVERMGGQIGVKSNLREGSRFWVDLP
jgi:PAS domain S-box-containing protein